MCYPAFRVVILVAASFLLCSSLIRAQNGPPVHPPRPKVLGPAKWDPSPQEVSAAYWTLEPGWNTNVEMRNNLGFRELTVTPVLRAASGKEVSLTPVTVAAQHVISLDLRNLAQSQPQILNGAGSFGSVAFRFSGLDSANLFAATIVRREGQPIDFHFDADDAGSPLYTTGGIEGMWWVPDQTSNDYLILTNPAEKTVAGALILSLPSANRRIQLSIGPGQTQRIDLRETLGPSSIGAMGGLTLSLPGRESLSVTQIVFDEVTGLAAIMKLFDREPDDEFKDHTLLAPMMALSLPDEGLGFPSGTTLIPRLFLRNAGSGQAKVSLTVDWRSESKSGKFTFPQSALSSGEVRVIKLMDQQKSGQVPVDAMWGTVKLSYTGRRADLVAVALSYDKDNRYGLQTPFSEGVSRMWAGGMWHVDPTHNTFITTGNAGPESTAAEVTLFYNGGKGKYRLKKMLSPGQQMWLDIGQLIRGQIPDSDGHVLPPDAMNGSYELRDLDHATVGQLYEGKLVIDKTYGHASYGCSNCCGMGIPSLIPSPFGGPPGIDNQDFIHSTEQCSGFVDDVTDAGYGWSSSNTAVATLPTRTLHTVAVGTATGRAEIQLAGTHPAPRCPPYIGNPQQPVTVNKCPSSVSIAAKTNIPLEDDFPTYKTGIGMVASMQLGPPPSTSYNQSKVSEALSVNYVMQNTCPAQYFSECNGSATFTVGTGGTDYGVPFNPANNIFYDDHSLVNTSNVLSQAGLSTCTYSCNQTYSAVSDPSGNSCGNANIGSFLITYTFTTGTIQGTPVTRTTVAKQ